jgi:hypothetical protein
MIFLAGGVKHDVVIRQGDTWQGYWLVQEPSGKAVDLTGYSARLQIRPNAASSTVTASITNSATADGSIVVTSAGEVTATLTDEKTAAIAAGTYEYDVFLDDANGVSNCLSYGLVTVEARVTR